ncbi:hypothetical protein [Scytonema millei]|uniref:Uncharacterized protein n=1 Tax=Scytonema millei VB511283 TaxID=1245923 RepID=A0A9X5E8K0_9CYAN|nr:hypothetical protein [Scytonema millei]NHC36768.1 hypothetical protein [Scytonema millei VB511283]
MVDVLVTNGRVNNARNCNGQTRSVASTSKPACGNRVNRLLFLRQRSQDRYTSNVHKYA